MTTLPDTTPRTQTVDLAIIGSGSGNSIPDDRFDQKSIAIFEEGIYGGTCLNVGCIPTKMFVYPAEVADIASDGDRFGVHSRVESVDWPAIRDRVFGRIDPISTGGLQYRELKCENITVYDPLWLDRLRAASPERHARVSGLLLNSPWLDLQGEPVLRSYPVTMFIKGVAAVRPFEKLSRELSGAYGESLHVDSHGEWSYDLTMKPLGGFPVTFGFLNAVRSGQRHLHHGIDVGVPTLVLRSDKTKFAKYYSSAVDVADAVLDVSQIARWSGSLGGHVTVAPITGARHDVFLSVASARAQAYAEVDRWLDSVVEPIRQEHAS